MSANIGREKDQPEMILVPRKPTKEMLKAAFDDAHDEDAAGVWNSMVEAWLQESSGNSSSGNGCPPRFLNSR